MWQFEIAYKISNNGIKKGVEIWIDLSGYSYKDSSQTTETSEGLEWN
jgi:hypothetical protein